MFALDFPWNHRGAKISDKVAHYRKHRHLQFCFILGRFGLYGFLQQKSASLPIIRVSISQILQFLNKGFVKISTRFYFPINFFYSKMILYCRKKLSFVQI